LVNGYFSNWEVAEFLSGALQWLTEPVVVLSRNGVRSCTVLTGLTQPMGLRTRDGARG
jgi:hypothetical protein